MRIADSRSMKGIGFIPAQDHEAGVDPDMRTCLIGVRILDRLRTYDKLGAYHIEAAATGDIDGLMHWQSLRTPARPTGAWQPVWPAITTKQGGGTATGGGEPCCDDGPGAAQRMLPVALPQMIADARFVPTTYNVPMVDGKPIMPAYPPGTYGVALKGTMTTQQDDYFLPTDSRLIAPNQAGGGCYGTMVADLKEDDSIDPDRLARLQTHFWVIEEPYGSEHNSIAINTDKTGKCEMRGGLFIERAQGQASYVGGAAGQRRAIGELSQHYQGPLVAGHLNDKHKRGNDGDGRPINGGHISLLTNIYFSRNVDGPLHWDGFYERPNFFPDKRVPVHFEWDGAGQDYKWHSYCGVYIPPYTPEGPGIPEDPGGGGGGGGGGTTGGATTGGGGEGTVGGGGGGPFVGDDPFNPYGPVPAGDGGKIPPPPAPTPPSPVSFGGTDETQPATAEPGDLPGGSPSEREKKLREEIKVLEERLKWELTPYDRVRTERELNAARDELLRVVAGIPDSIPTVGAHWSEGNASLPFTASSQEFAAPVLLGRPQLMDANAADFRNLLGAPGALARQMDLETPITVRLEAYGQQDGNQWQYTQRPAEGRYFGGTAVGGINIGPPEVELHAILASPVTPDGLTPSKATLNIGPHARVGFGLPDITDGGVDNGWSMSWALSSEVNLDSALLLHSQDLVTWRHASAPTPSYMLEYASGAIAWKSATAFWGRQVHANTANRTYTFPDATGTVALIGGGGSLTAGRVVYTDALGQLATDAGLLYDDMLDLLSPGAISLLTGGIDMNGGDVSEIDELAFNDAAANPTAAGRLRRNGANLVYNGGLHAMDNLAAGDLSGARMIWDDAALSLALYDTTPLLAIKMLAASGIIEWGTIGGDPTSTRQLRNSPQVYGQDLRFHDGTAARSTINKVRKNGAGTIYSRPHLNFVDGDLTFTLGEDGSNGDVDVTPALGPVINEAGADLDYRFEGDNKQSLFKLDGGDDEVSIDGRFSLRPIAPSQITADQNDYNPESAATARSSTWVLQSDASRTITGIANGLDGRLLILTNNGGFNIVLAHESASSAAGNRIITMDGASLTLTPDDSCILQYNSGDSRWYVIAAPGGSSVSAATQAEQESGSSTTVYTSPARQHFHLSAAKFLVKFDASGTTNFDYNVTSVTDVGTGEWTVNIATDFATAHWAVSAIGDRGSDPSFVTIKDGGMGAGSVGVLMYTHAGSLLDPTGFICALGFGDLP